ncbi:G2/M phase-specific E3 ubiquitin-protein ligase, partial [Dissostichus eleginoides]
SGDRNSSVAAAAHTLITVLTQHLSQGQPEGRKEDQTLPDSTPTASEEFALAQAGLGKRHISMPLDMSHEEFFSLLKKEYPNCRRWMEDGSSTNQQEVRHEFDLTPLPADAECMEECLSSEEDIETTSEVEIVSVVHPVQKHTEKSLEEKVPCPICFESFTPRGLLQWQRQKGSSPTATLNVTFFGEAGVDTGALRKEFLTEVVAGIEGRFFEGPQQQRIPRYSLNDLDSDLYRTVGEILAVSLAQELIDQVESDTIVRAIILHAVLRLQPMLEQLREGLQLYGLLSLMSQYPDICQPLFVSGEDVKVNAEFDFLYEAEDHGHVDKDGLHPITPATFLQWITGQGHVPLLPSEKKDFAVVIQFNHDCSADFGPHSVCYPVVTACAKTITLPVRHMRPYEKFKNILTEAFQLGQEFSNV